MESVEDIALGSDEGLPVFVPVVELGVVVVGLVVEAVLPVGGVCDIEIVGLGFGLGLGARAGAWAGAGAGAGAGTGTGTGTGAGAGAGAGLGPEPVLSVYIKLNEITSWSWIWSWHSSINKSWIRRQIAVRIICARVAANRIGFHANR